jgi:O-antigen chain-terminating methyltransferase
MDPYRFAPPTEVARLQAKYVRFFTEVGAKRVLDLGCGRGIFLRLLGEAGIEALGVDVSAKAIEVCKTGGFAVWQEDALTTLQRLAAAGESFDGIFCSHLIEHLPSNEAMSLIARSAAVLKPQGRLVVVTPNADNIQVLTEGFWLDSSHTRFVPRLLVEMLMIDAGMRIVTSQTDPDAVSRWHDASRVRKFIWKLALGRSFATRHLISGLDAYVVGERVTGERV